MKKIQTLWLLLPALLLSSCYTSKISYNNMDRIQRGMSPKEVMAVLGEPSYRSFDAKGETLEFRDTEYGTAKVVKIWLVDQKVVEMKSYLDRDTPGCSHNVEAPKEKKADQSKEKDTSSKIRVTTDGKHLVQMGSVIVTPEGKHEIVVSDAGGLIITASGELIHAF